MHVARVVVKIYLDNKNGYERYVMCVCNKEAVFVVGLGVRIFYYRRMIYQCKNANNRQKKVPGTVFVLCTVNTMTNVGRIDLSNRFNPRKK